MTTLRLARTENNPVEVGSLDEEFPDSEPMPSRIEPRSEFLARIRREEFASARVDATIEIDAELRTSGLYPIWSGGSASVIVAGRRCRIVPDSAARPYEEWR